MPQLMDHHDKAQTNDGQSDPQNRFHQAAISFDTRRAHPSASMISSSVGRASPLCLASVFSTILAMSVKRILLERKACTAISSAAFKTAGKVPPWPAASRASARHGKRLKSG